MLQIKRAAIKVFQIENENGMYQVTVPLEQAMRDYNEAMYDVINPKAYHQGRIDDVVQKFLAECRFGQTQIGSYITSIVCPFAEVTEKNEYHQLSIFSEEEECAHSLTRNVTNKLMDSIEEIKNQIDNADVEKLIEDTEISRNFYEALLSMNLESKDAILEFETEWSPIVKENRTKVNHIKLSHDYFQPIYTIIEKKKTQKEKLTQILGRISRLDSSPAADMRTGGIVKIENRISR